MNIEMGFEYKFEPSLENSLNDNYFSDVCRYENLTVIIEDGNWKIINASILTLGNFKDSGDGRANYYQNSNLEGLRVNVFDNYPSYCQ
jgi:hypothetical protein